MNNQNFQMIIELRPYQGNAVHKLRVNIANGIKRQLLCVPTGGGKTVIFSAVIQSAVSKGKKVLVLAHRRELINQCAEKLEMFGVNHGLIVAGSKGDSHGQVNVASIQTLIKRDLPECDLIVIDEAHLAAAKTYRDIMANYPNAYVLGVTATPERLDGKGLDDLFSDMVEVCTVQDLIQQGFLINPVIYGSSFDKKQISNVRTRGGDYNESELQDAMDTPKLNGDIVSHWRKLANNKLTIVFACGIEHAKHIAEEFTSFGVSAAYISGDMTKFQRDCIISDWKKGIIKVVANCAILTEGFDFPELECCILARPTQSVALYLQMIGRVLRTHPNKSGAIVLDHAGNVLSHGTPDIKREWSLEGAKKRKRKDAENYLKQCDCGFIFEPEAKLFLVSSKLPKRESGICTCPSCNQSVCVSCNETFILKAIKNNVEDVAFTIDANCPHCNATYSDEKAHIVEERSEELPDTTDENLTRYEGSIEPLSIEVKNKYKSLMIVAKQRGFKRGYVFHQIITEFGEEAKQFMPRHKGEWWKEVAA